MTPEPVPDPPKVWVVSFCDGGVTQEPLVFETEPAALAAIAAFAKDCDVPWNVETRSWDFSESDADARVDCLPVQPGFLVR